MDAAGELAGDRQRRSFGIEPRARHCVVVVVVEVPVRQADWAARHGFDRGGWAFPYHDDTMASVQAKWMAESEAVVLGRRTYEDFYGFWPKQVDNPFTEVLNRTTKYVASTTLSEPLPWSNSALLDGDPADAVGELRKRPGKDLVVIGSGVLVSSLSARDLVDEWQLMIYPLVLGQRRRLGGSAALRLVDSVTTSTGVVIATYQPEREGRA